MDLHSCSDFQHTYMASRLDQALLRDLLSAYGRHSDILAKGPQDSGVLILDNLGLLAHDDICVCCLPGALNQVHIAYLLQLAVSQL